MSGRHYTHGIPSVILIFLKNIFNGQNFDGLDVKERKRRARVADERK